MSSSPPPTNQVIPMFTNYITTSPTKMRKSFSLSASLAESVEEEILPPSLSGNAADPMRHTATPSQTLRIVPYSPEDISATKYKRSVFHPSDPNDSKVQKIQPLQRRFKKPTPPPGWVMHICPEGQRYFHHKKKSVVTLTNLCGSEPENLKHISAAADKLWTRFQETTSGAGRPFVQRDRSNTIQSTSTIDETEGFTEENVAEDDAELCLQIMEDSDGETIMAYYFASMAEQSVFWLDEVDTSIVTSWERAVVTESHLEHAVRSQFWSHVETFPNHRGLPGDVVQDLKDVYTYGLCDYITSETSMFPYDPETVNSLTKSLERIRENEPNGSTTFVVARLFYAVHRERFLSFWGEEGARLDRQTSAFAESIHKPRSLWFNLISPFLFFMPLVYMNELDKLYVDQSVHYYFWRQFITGLRRDWDNSITPATVLLSANVGFLAINSIDVNSPNKSAAQISSYISAILSLFIYIVCQILTRHHRHEGHSQANKAIDYITKREGRLIGLQAVALAFSLPTALFLWSMLTFLAAMMFVFFDDTSAATRISVGVVLAVLGVMIALLLYLERESTISGEGSYIRLFNFFRETLKSWGARLKPQKSESLEKEVEEKVENDEQLEKVKPVNKLLGRILFREPRKTHSMADTESTYVESINSTVSKN
ncbi:hypothetical protein PHLGIDRAFT_113920 [Phlebiopsis gigantea 11061_1 CR5-6]|uniref:WW domain-containing protein n=1 Tax=Phlebiopsis gigantea (strain 11061_1 CR5-6) TaxID=745531 RepID=A0A0C3P2J4_PHLG1|nr:hypothetical protein PHLGIDRAFT_113920 [Phlebiopsis gigantea 11061_1 CR5-6]